MHLLFRAREGSWLYQFTACLPLSLWLDKNKCYPEPKKHFHVIVFSSSICSFGKLTVGNFSLQKIPDIYLEVLLLQGQWSLLIYSLT